MDPTFREQLRAWIVTADVRDAVTETGQERLLELVGELPLKAHRVKVPDARIVRGSHVGELTCPDCRRGLVSRGTDLICVQLPMTTEVTGNLATGLVVACGEGRSDG